MKGVDRVGSQEDLAHLVGVSQPAIADLVRRGVVRPGDTLGEQLLAYCAHLRAIAAQRIESPGVATERERLLRAQAEAAERENHKAAGLLVRREDIERDAARAARLVLGAWEGAAAQFARQAAPHMEFRTALDLAERVIRATRNDVAAALELGEARPTDG